MSNNTNLLELIMTDVRAWLNYDEIQYMSSTDDIINEYDLLFIDNTSIKFHFPSWISKVYGYSACFEIDDLNLNEQYLTISGYLDRFSILCRCTIIDNKVRHSSTRFYLTGEPANVYEDLVSDAAWSNGFDPFIVGEYPFPSKFQMASFLEKVSEL